jgi:hypothetical protein
MFTKLVKGKEKGKIGPVLSQLSTMPWGYVASALDGGERSVNALFALPSRYSLERRFGWPQNWSRLSISGEKPCTAGNRTRAVKPVTRQYFGWVNPALSELVHCRNFMYLFLYNDAFRFPDIAYNIWMIGEWWIVKCVQENGRGLLLKYFLVICLERLRKTTRTLEIFCVPTEIRTRDLLITESDACMHIDLL